MTKAKHEKNAHTKYYKCGNLRGFFCDHINNIYNVISINVSKFSLISIFMLYRVKIKFIFLLTDSKKWQESHNVVQLKHNNQFPNQNDF